MRRESFLFVSRGGASSDLAWRIQRERHSVRMFIADEGQRDVADGFVDKTADWREDTGWADVIVFDGVPGQGQEAEELRRQGKAVIGGTAWTDRLQEDRAFGQEELRKAGVEPMPRLDFEYFEDAVRHIRNNPGRYVLEPGGKERSTRSLVFVGQHPEGDDVLGALARYQKAGLDIRPFQLQPRIEGVEVGVGGFFNGQDFVQPLQLVFEHRRQLAGGLGFLTGGMGTGLLWSPPTPLFERTLGRLSAKLAEAGCRGVIHLDCIANADGLFPLGLTLRLGPPNLAVQLEAFDPEQPAGGFFAALARGEASEVRIRSRFQVGVRLVVPPYPARDPRLFDALSRDAAIHLLPAAPGLHIEGVKKVQGQWRVAGSSGAVLTAAGTGNMPQQARRRAYEILAKVQVPNQSYRTDIAERWPDDLDRLREWGYLGSPAA